LKQIERCAFSDCDVWPLLPSTLVFLAHAAPLVPTHLTLSDADSCPAFDRWRGLRANGVVVDFHRLVRADPFKSPPLDMTKYEEGSVMRSSGLYQRRSDRSLMVVPSISLSESIEDCQLATEIENLANLPHPLIVDAIGFERTARRELKIARSYARGGSLAEVLSNPPPWWTPTAKAKAMSSVCARDGTVHGALKAGNVLFDADHRIQIADFSRIRLVTGDVAPFGGERWSPEVDVVTFVPLLSAIVAESQPHLAAFVSRILKNARSPEFAMAKSFANIFELLKANHFQVMAGVDSDEVTRIVRGDRKVGINQATAIELFRKSTREMEIAFQTHPKVLAIRIHIQ
jgi:hypothetical protein